MKNWVSRILVPYFEAQKRQRNLSPDQRCILQLDCWSVHRSKEFRHWLKATYPWIMLMYIPGGCTGLFQACDVGIQRVLKLAIRNASHTDIVEETVNVLRSCVEPEYVVNDQTLPTLRRCSLNWIVQAYHAINRSDLIKKAFALCAVPNTAFNLSYESLVSVAARQALVQLSASNPVLYGQIASNHDPALQAASTQEEGTNIDNDLADEPGIDNDLNPTIEEVCQVILQANTAHEVAQPITEANGLSDGGNTEDIAQAEPAVLVVRSDKAVRRSGRIRRGRNTKF
ncbi:hypothetical protein FRC06_003753 [Ceratobasidium sp. 370]|nr:hypothetical protein FRC06_003753 [Ceratobasidium sp. 370]